MHRRTPPHAGGLRTRRCAYTARLHLLVQVLAPIVCIRGIGRPANPWWEPLPDCAPCGSRTGRSTWPVCAPCPGPHTVLRSPVCPPNLAPRGVAYELPLLATSQPGAALCTASAPVHRKRSCSRRSLSRRIDRRPAAEASQQRVAAPVSSPRGRDVAHMRGGAIRPAFPGAYPHPKAASLPARLMPNVIPVNTVALQLSGMGPRPSAAARPSQTAAHKQKWHHTEPDPCAARAAHTVLDSRGAPPLTLLP
jgi:hypothetical protein